jgi:hypothetical protein
MQQAAPERMKMAWDADILDSPSVGNEVEPPWCREPAG